MRRSSWRASPRAACSPEPRCSKTEEQEAIWGGTAGEQFDPCYHLACDTFDNVDLHALEVNSDLIAFAQLTFAYSTESVNGVPGKRVPGPPIDPAGSGRPGGHLRRAAAAATGPASQPRNEAADPNGGGPRDRPRSNPRSGSRGWRQRTSIWCGRSTHPGSDTLGSRGAAGGAGVPAIAWLRKSGSERSGPLRSIATERCARMRPIDRNAAAFRGSGRLLRAWSDARAGRAALVWPRTVRAGRSA